MAAIAITKQQARRFMLILQGLSGDFEFRGKEGMLAYFRRVGCIQYDPLNVVGTNPELVLQSRIEDFDRGMLSGLLYQDRKLIDYWDKQMSIFPVEDWPYFKRLREHYGAWCLSNESAVNRVRSEIESRGFLCSGDLDDDEKVDWAWGPTRLSRAALEGMYHGGHLSIHHKVNTRKYYDLTERLIPEELHASPDPFETDEQYYAWYVLRRIGSVGLLWNRPSDAWLGIRGLKSSQRNEAFARLTEEKLIVDIQVEGIAHPLYMRTEDEPFLREALSYNSREERASILAPLDNLLWDRQLIKELFDFEYRWEVYKPAAERQYGYYVLPVVYGDRIVARFDPVKHRKNTPFSIRQWWWEEHVDANNATMRESVTKCLEQFAANLGTKYEASPI
ncbi:winged helix-turn-helix domain-containing protein [Cohnella endophytica]|uniref:Winged helix-turn-helix domain-containing protein n=1 Tax=Cohnella endophytica TaxID=2419778 RepID=A0A494XU54_9BACL|nr:crosslink repair DNA glycosylase YcaQ family protein [Cohnella endophytica]RKP51654.1 winged helix-turn-helix domain-containing protein [Cohnella endophytica]